MAKTNKADKPAVESIPSGSFDPGLDYPNFGFEVTHIDAKSRARLGRIGTPHGSIETPNYIFCGTKASIKNLSPYQMREVGTDIILANTYHLMIQPGAELVQKMGGLHKFMNWSGPMLTDSGGFQVFSMGEGTSADEIKGRGGVSSQRKQGLIELTEEGARFRSYKNGEELKLNPEISMDLQRKLGADLIVQMDECPPYHVSREYTANSMEMSHRWGDRSLAAFEKSQNGTQELYGVVHGGVYEDLRIARGQRIADRPFFGTAVGGCLGGSEEEMYGILDWVKPHLPTDRPVHFLGIGRIIDVFKSVRYGIDTFDCVIPTRMARHGMALERGNPNERINLMNTRYKDDPEPLDASLEIPASSEYSKAYLHHLLKAGEMLAFQIISQHNVAVMNRLMREVRQAIKQGTLDELQKEWIPS